MAIIVPSLDPPGTPERKYLWEYQKESHPYLTGCNADKQSDNSGKRHFLVDISSNHDQEPTP